MLLIVRMYPRYEVDKVWRFAEQKFSDSKDNSVIPLFMSEQDYQNYVSIMIELNDIDSLASFFAEDTGPCGEIAYTRTIMLLKPAFYPVSKDVPEGLSRYLIPVKMDPCHYTKVYDKILKIEPPKGVHLAYTALTFGEDDMLISVLAKDSKIVRKFVADNIETLDGVQSVRIGLTHRTKRLIDPQTWRKAQEMYSYSRFVSGAKGTAEYSFDWTYLDHCSIHGALPEEA